MCVGQSHRGQDWSKLFTAKSLIVMGIETFYIQKCKELVEEKLGWGSGTTWQNQDFENLGDKIYESTKIRLSTSTLKRLWGKARYKSTPNLATLNALAQFAGYENWRAFTSRCVPPIEQDVAPENLSQTSSEANPLPPSVKRGSRYLSLVLSLLLVAAVVGFLAFDRGEKKLTFQNISFTSNPVTQGLPNSVVFKYDASNSTADSVFIQQSWDSTLRRRVDKFQKEYVCTYYLPGYYRAKLILNDSIVKQHDVYLESQGWLGVIETEPIPIYLPKKDIEKQDRICISETDLIVHGIDGAKEIPWVSFNNVDRNKSAQSDNFIMEVELRNTYNKGDGVCQHTKIVLLGTDNVIIIPLSIKGCVGELELAIAEQKIKGTAKDLSFFGVDFNEWATIRCEVKNNYAKVFVNHQLAFEGQQTANVGKIVGARLKFKGAGEFRRFKLD